MEERPLEIARIIQTLDSHVVADCYLTTGKTKRLELYNNGTIKAVAQY